jgi:hypothetical protein
MAVVKFISARLVTSCTDLVVFRSDPRRSRSQEPQTALGQKRIR